MPDCRPLRHAQQASSRSPSAPYRSSTLSHPPRRGCGGRRPPGRTGQHRPDGLCEREHRPQRPLLARVSVSPSQTLFRNVTGPPPAAHGDSPSAFEHEDSRPPPPLPFPARRLRPLPRALHRAGRESLAFQSGGSGSLPIPTSNDAGDDGTVLWGVTDEAFRPDHRSTVDPRIRHLFL